MPDRFYDGQRGPDIRRELNNLEAVFDDAIANARGPQGWAPVVAVVTDGARRVLQITDWTGGEGTKPATGGYIGATGIVATATLAIDIRGPIGAAGPSNTLAIGTVTSAASPSATITGVSPNQTLNLVLPKGDKGDTGNTGPANTLTIGTVTTGTASATITGTAPTQVLNLTVPQGIQGIQGPKGDTGNTGATGPQGLQGVQGVKGDAGWSPIFATVADGARFVLQVTDWAGGAGTKPAVGKYVGATGFVDAIASGVNVRGPAGTGSVSPSGTVAANDLAAFVDSSGTSIKAVKPADLPVSTATQNALNAKAPLNGTGTSGTWPISVSGQSATVGTESSTKPSADLPVTWPTGLSVRLLDGIAGYPAGAHSGLLTSRPWLVGYGTLQLNHAYNSNLNGIWYRQSIESSGNWTPWRKIVDSGDVNTYAPTLTGTGANGTWPISITGSSASLLSTDSRSVKPTAIGSGSARTFFASKTGMEGGAVTTDWVDLFAFNTYNDGTGGLTNALAFSKAGAGLWHYQGVFNSAAWNAPKQIAYTDSSITGNAATATKLATARAINGVNFDGSADISVPVAWSDVTEKPAVIAAGADAAAARSAIGAGTSNLTLGTTAGTALAGNTTVLPEAPNDGKTYGRKNAAWAEVVSSGGDVTLTGTQTLTNKTIHGNANTLTVDGVNAVGFRHIPQNSQSAAYTLVLTDAGKHILHPAADTTARIFNIPPNSEVAFPIGTAITFINQNGTGGVVTIAITADTMRLAGAGTTGSRTLARNGVATAIKITATEWIISGSGLT